MNQVRKNDVPIIKKKNPNYFQSRIKKEANTIFEALE